MCDRLSVHMWNSYYTRIKDRLMKVNTIAIQAWREDSVDVRFNFGKEGAAKSFIPHIYPPDFYK